MAFPTSRPSRAPAPFPGNPSQAAWKAGTLVYTSGGLTMLFIWLLFGDFAWSMRDRSVGPMSQWYLNSLNVPNVLFGIILSSFPAMLGMILGPVISVKSDRYRSKWGRRIPFLLVTTPMAVAGMTGIALTPLLAKWLHTHHFSEHGEWVVSVACFGIFWAAFECATIAGQTVFGALINDVVPRHLLGRFYGMFRAVSLIDGMVFNYWVMGKAPSHFTLILVSIGIFYGLAFMGMCFKVKEGSYPAPPLRGARSMGAPTEIWKEVKTYVKECYANPYYLLIFLLNMFSYLSFAPVNIFSLPYARSLGIDMNTYGKFLALTYLISLCLSFFLGLLADLFHPLRMVIISLVGYILVTVWGALFADSQPAFLLAWVLHGVLSGCFLTTSASLGQRLFPHEKYAQFASAANTANAPAFMVISPLVGLVIDQTGNVYQYTFVGAAILAFIGVTIGFFVYRRFIQYGGTGNYAAP